MDEWNVACDSYGKVRHSKRACVYTTVKNERGETTQIVHVAQKITNWDHARLIAAAPELLRALTDLRRNVDKDLAGFWTESTSNLMQQADAAIAKAEGKDGRWRQR